MEWERELRGGFILQAPSHLPYAMHFFCVPISFDYPAGQVGESGFQAWLVTPTCTSPIRDENIEHRPSQDLPSQKGVLAPKRHAAIPSGKPSPLSDDCAPARCGCQAGWGRQKAEMMRGSWCGMGGADSQVWAAGDPCGPCFGSCGAWVGIGAGGWLVEIPGFISRR